MPAARLAPTPSGYLHIGNAFNFLLTEYIIRSQGGWLRLRIDDLDTARVKKEYTDDIFETLNWLGIVWDRGPADAVDYAKSDERHRRNAVYDDVIKRLIQTGKVFACRCSRSDLKRAETCRCAGQHIPFDAPDVALRIPTDDVVIRFTDIWAGEVAIRLADTMASLIIRRRDQIPSYQIFSLCDDLLDQTTDIVRGRDLMSSTAAQIWLAGLCGFSDFGKMRWYHHPLLVDHNNRKLSKSEGDTSIRHMRLAGLHPSHLYRQLAPAFGLNDVSSHKDLFHQLKSIDLKKQFNRETIRLTV